MILGALTTWEQQRESVATNIFRAVEELAKLANLNPEPGRIEIDGDNMYINVMELEVKSAEEQVAEKHEKYIDVHYLFSGDEIIGWSPQRQEIAPTKAYDDENDYMLYAPAEDEVLLTMKPGMFAVFYPEDIHRPNMGTAGQRIKKAVVKIKV